MDRRERTVTDKWDLRPKGAGAGNQEWRCTPVIRTTGKRRQEDCHELEANLGYLDRPSCLKKTKQSVGRISGWTWQPASRRRRDHRDHRSSSAREELLSVSMYIGGVGLFRPGGGEG